MAAAARDKKAITPDEWQRRLGDVKLNLQQMNALVMNFLVIEGHKDAAEAFAAESGAKPGIDLNSIADRMHVRTAVQQGKIKEAIMRVNDINTEILDSRPELVFRLRLLQLIELIRAGDLPAALQFAQDELAPRAENSPELLEELEKAMALLAIDAPDATSSSSPYLDGTLRHKLASEVNAAILAAQYQDQEPRLPQLLKLLLFSQSQLEEKTVFPKMSLSGNLSA